MASGPKKDPKARAARTLFVDKRTRKPGSHDSQIRTARPALGGAGSRRATYLTSCLSFMQEFVDFLGKQAPYDALSGSDLERMAARVETEYFAKGTVILEPDGNRVDCLRVIRKGAVQVLDRGQVIDELSVGDTFGHVSLLSGLAPTLSVIAVENTLCYRIPDPREFIESPERLTFALLGTRADHPGLTANRRDLAARSVGDYLRPPLECPPDTPIRDAAQMMSDEGLSFILIRSRDGLGIVTDSDCRSKVATGHVSIDAPVSAIASTPARTVDEGVTAAGAFVEMVHHGVHHLIVQTANGGTAGVVRVVDLSSSDIRDPLMVRAAVEEADTVDKLAVAVGLIGPTLMELFRAGTPAARIGALHSAIVEAVLERVVSLHGVNFGPSAPAEASWMVLGSLARREPLPLSDIDTGLVWKPRAGDKSVDSESMRAAAESVIQDLEKCGLRRCPDGANANNPLFNRSLEAWIASAHGWRREPDGPGALLLSSIIADSRPVTGLSLGKILADELSGEALSKRFLRQMLRNALAHKPPTGFVREFVVEASGRHRGELDLKRGGLLPVVAIGRWVGLTTRDPSGSTLDRIRRGNAAGLLTADESGVLEHAFEDLYELLYERELDSIEEGSPVSTYLAPKELDTLARRHLRETFKAIARVQSRLESEWVSRLN